MFDAACSEDARWRAVERRDGAADGRFYCCVKTTGVYCLPSCSGRPQRRNVFFVETRAEAEARGLRPCKRCRPDRWIHEQMADRLAAIDWSKAASNLNSEGFTSLGRLLNDDECRLLASLYDREGEFRSRVVMARHGFGAGEYKYFADPLPELVSSLRERLYERLSPAASRWRALLGGGGPYPATLCEYRRVCAAVGQARPTPLLLTYKTGDYNRLHQDLYGSEIFPIQVAILLSEAGKDFEGGELVLTEQRPRMQSRAHVVPVEKGDAVAFAVNDRPVPGAKGPSRARMRHGVSTIRSGRRMVLGVIFHDAL